jgi:hypothetical protein
MFRFLITISAVVSLSGCASTIMQGYVQQDVRTIMLDYGPPENAFDMQDGTRAFQWIMRKSGSTPTTVHTTGTISGSGTSAWVSTNSTIIGGRTIESSCVYTLFARWSAGTKGWVVESFHKPKFICE